MVLFNAMSECTTVLHLISTFRTHNLAERLAVYCWMEKFRRLLWKSISLPDVTMADWIMQKDQAHWEMGRST